MTDWLDASDLRKKRARIFALHPGAGGIHDKRLHLRVMAGKIVHAIAALPEPPVHWHWNKEKDCYVENEPCDNGHVCALHQLRTVWLACRAATGQDDVVTEFVEEPPK